MDDETWEYYRKEAMEWAMKRDQAFRSSRNAYNRGDGATAKHYSNLGKRYKRLCDEANKSAANAIFIEMNENRPLTEIDLHGLYVYEAIEKLETRVIYAVNNNMKRLDVIAGQGHHSEDGPKIKQSVQQFANENAIHYSLNYQNPGCIHFNFGYYDGSSNERHRHPIKQNNGPARTVRMFNIQEPETRNQEPETSETVLLGIAVVFFILILLINWIKDYDQRR